MKNSFIILIAILFMGCANTDALRQYFARKSYTGLYLMESKINTEPKTGSVYIEKDVKNTDEIRKTTTIKRHNAFIIPLIVFNYWQSKHSIKAGKSIIKEQLDSLVIYNLLKEARRSGNFNVSDQKSDGDITVELSIDSLEMFGYYRTLGFAYFALFAYGYHHGEYAGPGYVRMQTNVNYWKNNELLYTEKIKLSKNISEFPRNPAYTDQLQRDYAICMVETFSDVLSTTNRKIVDRISALNKP